MNYLISKQETQLLHEVSMKSDLLQKYLKESEYDDLVYSNGQSNQADTDDSRRCVISHRKSCNCVTTA